MTEQVTELFSSRSAPSQKCTAHSKRTGAPCNNPPVAGLTVCRMHGGATKAAKAAARRRIDEAADRMAKQLLKMATDDNVSDAVKLTAIRDALDRAGLKAPTTVEVEVGTKPWDGLAEKIVGFAASTRAESRVLRGIPQAPSETGSGPGSGTHTSARSDDEIVDAEIIDDQEPAETSPVRPTGMRPTMRGKTGRASN
jgi:hypothetical protein